MERGLVSRSTNLGSMGPAVRQPPSHPLQMDELCSAEADFAERLLRSPPFCAEDKVYPRPLQHVLPAGPARLSSYSPPNAAPPWDPQSRRFFCASGDQPPHVGVFRFFFRAPAYLFPLSLDFFLSWTETPLRRRRGEDSSAAPILRRFQPPAFSSRRFIVPDRTRQRLFRLSLLGLPANVGYGGCLSEQVVHC